MHCNFFPWRSLKTRLTLTTLAIFLIGIWLLAFYASRMLREDMQRLLGEHQFSMVSFMAAEIDHELDDRLKTLEKVAGSVNPALFKQPAALQSFLEDSLILQGPFNGGVIAYRLDGTAIAEMPLLAGRIGSNDMEVDCVAAALREGKSTIGRPLMGKKLRAPVIGMAVPVRDTQGQVIGALAGVTNLSQPSFLDKITQNRYGASGYYLLEEPHSRLIITGTDKRRVMQPLPAPGSNPLIDRHIQGYDETGVTVNPLGVEVLASARRVPVAGWFIVAALPTAEAFAPIRAMQQRMLIATLLLTLLAGSLTWWMLRRQLSPMLAAVETLAALSDAGQVPQPLPITRQDEIGDLIGGFNHLLDTLGKRENALKESEFRWKFAIEGSGDGVWDWNIQTDEAKYSKHWKEMRGYAETDTLPTKQEWADRIHPDDQSNVAAAIQAYLEGKTAMYVIEYRLRCKDERYKCILSRGTVVSRSEDGTPLRMIGTNSDITQRKQDEKYEKFRSHTLELLAGGEPLSSILEAIARGVEQLHPTLLCNILLLDGTGRHLVQGAAPSLPDFYTSAIDGLDIGIGFASCGTAAGTGQRVIVDDIATHPFWASYRELAASAGLGACWSQPIHSSAGQVLGTFAIYHPEARTPVASDIAILEQSARLASIAIERSVAAKKLRDSEERFRHLFNNNSSVMLLIAPASGEIIAANTAAATYYGYPLERLTGMLISDINTLPPERIAEERQRALHEERNYFIFPHRLASGEVRDVEVRSTPIFSAGRTLLFSIVQDITEHKRAEEKLHLAASVFTHAREGIMITAADGTIIDVNDTFTRITGYSRDEVLGRNPRLLNSGRQEKEFYATLWRELIENGHWYGEVWNRRKNGEVYAEMQTISAVHDAQGNIRQYVSLFSDITPLKEHAQQLEHIAHYDALTALPNRVLLADRLHQSMTQAQRRGQRLAVVYLDLDGFKAVNDRHGHAAGDQLLMTVASRMKQALRESDTLARLGGDEFVAVLLDLADMAASVPLLSRLLAAAAQPVQVGDLMLQVSASLGVSFYPQAEEMDADQLLRQADQAMYQAKLAGKNRYHVFDAEQARSIRGHHASLERIRRALAGNEFVLYYQPKVNMRSGTVIGAEALIRWQHPERGLLPPALFLPLIENHPLAIDLGEWVIDTALTQMALWHAAGLDIPVSVNVGARQLQQVDFVERLRDILAAHPNVRPGDLELEVLETSALEDLARVSQVIESCREIGVSFAMDDFGTGYSSLTYLKRLPVTLLKIDQSFVRDMLDDPDDLAILEGVIGLATTFRRQVIAEGVETLEHGEMLLQLGCELAQGYGIAHPMPAHQLPGWSAAWRPDPAWVDLSAVSRKDLPLLFAGVEHRAWVVAMENHLKGECEAPLPLDHRQCRFGTWLDAEGQISHGAHPAFQTIELLHQQVHALAVDLCELQAWGRNPEALARLGELHGLRDALLEQVKSLVQESR